MTQRPSFWSRHASPRSDNPRQSNSTTRDSGHAQHQGQGLVARDHLHDNDDHDHSSAASSYYCDERSHAPSATPAYLQPRLPSNSAASPVANTSANTAPAPSSFSSSYSSSPSPSPSINPYAGSLRSMLQGARPSQTQPQALPSTPKALGPSSTMPANIRRSGGPEPASSSTSPLPSRHSTEGAAQAALHTTDYRRLQPQPQPQLQPQPQPQPQPQQRSPQAARLGSSNRDARCEQIVQNFYSKVAQVIAHLRAYTSAHTHNSYRYDSTYTEGASAILPPSRLMATSTGGQSGSSPVAVDAPSASSSLIDVGASGRRVNKWFNLDLEDIAEVKEEAKLWRHAAIAAHPSQAAGPHPPPMIIEVYLDVSSLSLDDELQVADIYGRPWNVDLEVDSPDSALEQSALKSSRGSRGKRRQRVLGIVLESWRLDLATGAAPTPAPDLPRVYKQAIVFFRNLYAFANLLPAVPLIRQLQNSSDDGLVLSCSFRLDSTPRVGVVGLDVSLTGTETFLEQHSFEPVVTPMGTFTLDVQYRRECLFSYSRPQRQQALHGFSDIGAIDNAYFTPTLSSRSGSCLSPPPQQQQHIARRQQLQPPQQHARPESQGHGLVATSERPSVMMPSVNPFRARPLSLGDSSSLPNYIGDLAHRRVPSRLSSEWNQASDLLAARSAAAGHSYTSRGPQRRISLGARVPAADSAHGGHAGDSLHADGPSSGHSNASSARAHSFDHRTGSSGARLSSSGGGAAESGSMLHRSVMLRRFGDSLSPTEPQRQFDFTAGRTSGSSERHRFGPTSPPKPTITTAMRQPSSGSTGLGSGRWTMGIAPFKSPSLTDSPSQSVGSIAGAAAATGESPRSASSRRGDAAKLSPQSSLEANRIRGHTFSHDGALLGLTQHADAQQLIAKLSESPSSLGSNASGHSRGLSSSFGNRRASLVQRQHSILTRLPTDHHPSSDSASFAVEGPALPRRHTIVADQTEPLRQPVGDIETQDIDAFIRMVDTRRPLGTYSRKGSTKQVGTQRRSSALSGGARTSSAADANPGSERAHRVAGGESLRMYQGVLNQFSSISQDMQSSVVLPDKLQVSPAWHRPLPSMSEDAEANDDGAIDELSSSPFRRMAMPNPLRGGDRPTPSRPVSLISVAMPGSGPQASRGSLESSSVAAAVAAEQSRQHASATSALGDGRSLDKLQRAFGSLAIESQDEPTQQTYKSDARAVSSSVVGLPPINAPGVARPHIRSAAPGLDARNERPLPQPVSIPRAASGTPRRAVLKQPAPPSFAYMELEQLEDSRDQYADAKPSEPRMRGKSQPLQHAPELSFPATPRVATPQPPGLAQSQAYPSGSLYRLAPLALPLPPLPASLSQRPIQPSIGGPPKRLSPELRPLSHRSDFISSNHQLGALLSMADNTSYARDLPRSTPTTPLLGALPALQRGSSGNGLAEASDAELQSNRLRSNFPPLSFIVPRHRMDPYASPPPRSKEPASGRQYAASNSRPEEDYEDEDDEDLMFQMESSTC